MNVVPADNTANNIYSRRPYFQNNNYYNPAFLFLLLLTRIQPITDSQTTYFRYSETANRPLVRIRIRIGHSPDRIRLPVPAPNPEKFSISQKAAPPEPKIAYFNPG